LHACYYHHAGSGSLSAIGSPRRVNIERIRVLMESENDLGVEVIRKAFTYYQSCLSGDTTAVSINTFNQILEQLGKTLNSQVDMWTKSQELFQYNIPYGKKLV
jgi:hypothetical protein